MGDDRPNTYVEDGVVIYRASSLGNCIRSLVASRLGMEPMPHPDWLLEKFEQGNENEPVILGMLEEAGWQLADKAQLEVEVAVGKGVKIRGHLDGIGREIGEGASLINHVVEAKAFGKSFWEKFLKQGIFGFPYYVTQLVIYTSATGLPAVFVVGIKDDEGVVDRISTTFYELGDLGGIGQVKAKIAKVESWVKRGELPPCDYEQYPCQFYHLHEDSEEIAAPGESDLEMDLLASTYILNKRMEKEYGDLRKEAGDQMLKILKSRVIPRFVGKGYEVSTVSRANTSVDYAGLAEEVGREVVAKHTKTTKSEYVKVTEKKNKKGAEDAS